jgi:hypothetical protein
LDIASPVVARGIIALLCRAGGIPGSLGGDMRPGVAVDEERPARAWPGPLPRLVPLAAVAVVLAGRLAAYPPTWGSTAEVAAVGFGALAAAALVHLAALRLPGRYAVEGASWVATIAAILLTLPLILAGGD